MIVTEEKVKKHHKGLVKLFKRFNIEAAVNAKNVQNAMKGIPAFANSVRNGFDGFDGEENFSTSDPNNEVEDFANEGKEGASKEVEDDFDALTGEPKPKKKKRVLQNAMEVINNNAETIDTVKTFIKTAQNKDGLKTEEVVQETETEKKKKKSDGKIFGIDSTIFWGIAIVLLLIIILTIVKAIK